MVELTDSTWISRLGFIDFAFQPIVNIHTGTAFGFEALLRNHEAAGFATIDALFDQAFKEGMLHQVDLVLRKKALAKFSAFKQDCPVKLFFNLDNRLLDSGDYAPGNTLATLESYGYSQDDVCFEISEKHKIYDSADASKTLAAYRSQGFKIAVDDCGAGFSGLQLLYYTEPDYIKIDRFFIQNLAGDPKKRLLVSTIVNLAHFMGCLVMAEGVETPDEFNSCREIGCDMVQGYHIQRPTLDTGALKTRYPEVKPLTGRDRRNSASKDRSLIKTQINPVRPVYSDCDIITLFEKFRTGEDASFFPVVNHYNEPLGIIRDTAFKDFIFSKFGRQLLENPAFGRDISRFITKLPIADIHSSVEKLIEVYTQYNGHEGLLIVDNMKYLGYLSPHSLLRMINEKNLNIARNQNPLTRLPGNALIHDYFAEALADITSGYLLIYFDFDNFKSYNDTYGFRNGDRLLLMFSDMLKKASLGENRFAGHVGGDDFFMGIQGEAIEPVEAEMKAFAETFRRNAESFYDREAITKGYCVAKDRNGAIREIPLVTVSTAILELPGHGDRSCSMEQVSLIIADLKKQAKGAATKLCSATILDYSLAKTVDPQAQWG
ncbi:MAG: EAL domain-containing protein [Desulfobacteraceae bacterium]|nr:EAL domain-containing protein [Desulfobacteraceae bacterium]